MNKKLVTDRYISSFLEQLYLLVKAGVPLDESIGMLSKGESNKESKELLNSLLKDLLEGKDLHTAIDNSKVFPHYMTKMIKAGETTGHLEDTLKSLYEYYDRMDRLNTSIKNAVFYPSILAVMMLAVILVLITKVMPIFSEVYEQMGSTLTGFSLAMLNIGKFLNHYALPFIIIVAVMIILLMWLLKSEKGKSILIGKLRKSNLYGEIVKSRFSSVMAMALGSGLEIDEALDLSLETTNDIDMEEKVKSLKEQMAEGVSFSDAVNEVKLLSEIDARFLSVGVKTGSVDKVMKQIADRSEEEANEHINSLISKVEPSLVIVLAVITGAILLSVMIPLANIISLIG
ncbi:type II secretion system F family protein [uncultured Anaerofustis sp.]|uniref:type II secretion system F family protein n=1 Tax=uncultured Anaerofustis sp. TaxID=904996 RepID=UPI0025EB8EC7|nr:type II secretion system F family protein [uncultured Anaerofustis sp.]